MIDKYIYFNDDSDRIFYSTMAGILEDQLDHITSDCDISYQDKQFIRKMVDTFYYIELNNLRRLEMKCNM